MRERLEPLSAGRQIVKRSVRHLILSALTALTLAAGYGTARSATRAQAPSPQLQTQTQEEGDRKLGASEQENEDVEDREGDAAGGPEDTDEAETAASASSASTPAGLSSYGAVSLQEAIERARARPRRAAPSPFGTTRASARAGTGSDARMAELWRVLDQAGAGCYQVRRRLVGSEAVLTDTFGVLELTLAPRSTPRASSRSAATPSTPGTVAAADG